MFTLNDFFVEMRDLFTRIWFLVGAVIALAFAYASVPVEWELVRGALAFVQFAFIVVTLAVTAKFVLEDY